MAAKRVEKKRYVVRVRPRVIVLRLTREERERVVSYIGKRTKKKRRPR